MSSHRRDFLSASAAIVGGAVLGSTGESAVRQVEPPPVFDPLKEIWKWFPDRQEWLKLRLEHIKKGDTFLIETVAGSGYMYHCTATSTPTPPYGEEKSWGINANVYNVYDVSNRRYIPLAEYRSTAEVSTG